MNTLFSKIVYFIIVISFFGLLAACDKNKASHSEKLNLTEKQMIEIIKEIQITEAALNYKRNNGSSAEENKELYFDLVFKKHKITPEIFKDNLLEYSKSPEILEAIYDSVIVSLTQMQDTLKIEESKEKDSEKQD
jgi:hypothetical protein